MDARYCPHTLAPRPPTAHIPTSKSLAHERIPNARPIDEHDPQLATIRVLVSIDGLQRDRAGFEQIVQAPCRSVTKFLLGRAAVIVGFWRIYVGHPDLHALQPDRVAIHD